MRVVLQRVSSASVTIGGRVTGQIERGLLVLVSVEDADTAADGEWLARKIVRLRIFADDSGQLNRSVRDLDPASDSQPSLPGDDPDKHRPASRPERRALNSQPPRILVISQFTLHASTQKGTRPSFNRAARPEHARPLYEQFVAQLRAALAVPPAVSGVERVQTGEFGAYMEVALVNDGPVTLIIDSKIRE
jgi:D-tyrosyl-tRNA(Tyr) deacylase